MWSLLGGPWCLWVHCPPAHSAAGIRTIRGKEGRFGIVVKNPQSWWPRGLMLEKEKFNYLKKNALWKFVWYSGWKNYNKIEIVKNYALYGILTNVKILLVWIIHMKCDLEGFLFVAALFCIKHVNYPQKFYWIDYII